MTISKQKVLWLLALSNVFTMLVTAMVVLTIGPAIKSGLLIVVAITIGLVGLRHLIKKARRKRTVKEPLS